MTQTISQTNNWNSRYYVVFIRFSSYNNNNDDDDNNNNNNNNIHKIHTHIGTHTISHA